MLSLTTDLELVNRLQRLLCTFSVGDLSPQQPF